MTAAIDTAIDKIKLEKLAEVAVKVGLDLQPGQDLVITAPLAAAPLARFITKHAYLAGGGLVTTFYSDEVATLMRYAHASDDNFDKASSWLYKGMAEAYANGAARLAIAGDNPMLLANEDPAKVARANRALSTAYKPALEHISNFNINWNIVAYPNPSWARQIFPDLPEAEALAAANKRVGNILKKSDGGALAALNPALLQEKAEQALAAALAEGVYLVKPSLRELRELTGMPLDSDAQRLEAARQIIARGQAELVALSLGEEGALLVPVGQALRARAVPVTVASTIGAGDSFVGGLVWALGRQAGLEEAFRYAMAAAAAALLTSGTALCQPADVERLCGQVVVTPV